MSQSPLFGRQRELKLLDGMLARLPEHGSALVIRGEAGIGKSALLDVVTTQARAHGLQF